VGEKNIKKQKDWVINNKDKIINKINNKFKKENILNEYGQTMEFSKEESESIMPIIISSILEVLEEYI